MATVQSSTSTSSKEAKEHPPLGAYLTDGALLQMYLGEFALRDTSGSEVITKRDMINILQSSMLPNAKDVKAVVDGAQVLQAPDEEAKIGLQEYCDVLRLALSNTPRPVSQRIRLPCQHMTAEQYKEYCKIFNDHACGTGLINYKDMETILTSLNVTIAPEKVHAVLGDVDESGSNSLDQEEFVSVLVRCLGLKKRKVGPSECTLSTLLTEGWSLLELKRLGYDVRSFLDAGFELKQLIPFFSAADLRRCGTGAKELLAVGWNCGSARDAGFHLEELLQAGASIKALRHGGYNDAGSAAAMRKLKVDAQLMRHGGWTLCELRLAGYSSVDLRLAGYSVAGLHAVQRMCEQQRGWKERRNTQEIRFEVDSQAVAEVRVA
mmetsp:Transcript_51984/g.96201  ORF Transcript_51984/g.96201 Transcript_51984/m.96201 type:complete len:378 (+) Transcript_51984:73-1206(+)